MAELPSLHVSYEDPLDLAVDALIVPVFRGGIEAPGAAAVLAALGISDVPRDRDFRGRLGETLDLAAPGLACRRVTLVGLGRVDGLSAQTLRRAAGSAARHLADKVTSVATTLALAEPDERTLRAVAEGFLLGTYRYDDQRSDHDPITLETITLVAPSTLEKVADEVLRRALVHARAECVARDLVNLPSRDKAPEQLVERAVALVGDGVTIEIWDEDRLAAERCGGVLAVGKGSSRPPRMLLLRHRPADPVASVALVGKGITFDTGGLSLKRPNSVMVEMKSDMGGAAAIIGVFSAIAELRIPVEVLGICAIAENMPSGDAQRPGDVFTARNGMTVEVLNTDAEGRLVLADALSYAAEQKPDAIIDLATLTGSVRHAVGKRAIGAFSNDSDLIRQVLAAAEAAGEPAWHLPLWDDLRDNLDSEIADLNNTGVGDLGGATIAGLFLREFVDERPWVHLDIAGAAWGDKARHHLPEQGTGAGVRTILHWLEQASD